MSALMLRLLGPFAPALALAFLAPVSVAGAQGSHDEAIAAILRRREGDTRSRAELVDALARLGPDLIPTWRAWLAGAGFERVFLEGDELVPARWLVLPEDAGALALATLGCLPPADVVAELERTLLRNAPDAAAALDAFRILEALASARGLALCWELVARLGPDACELPSLRAQAVRALGAILAADSAAWPLVQRRLQKPDPSERELLIAALRAADRPEGHALLRALLRGESDSAERLDILRGLAALERHHPWRVEPELVTLLRAEWSALEPGDQYAAVELYTQSEDPAAVPALFELLESPDPCLWRGAQAALAAFSGVDFGRDFEAWKAWQARELGWWSERFEPVLAELDGDAAAAAVARVLGELAAHPLHRRAIARGLGAHLSGLAPDAQRLVGRFLAALGTHAALPAMFVLARKTADQALAAELRAALAALGQPPGSEGLAVRDLLGN